MMINANTEHLEGAYAFLSYTLSKNGQNFVDGEPVNKEMWEHAYQYQQELSERMQLVPDPDYPDAASDGGDQTGDPCGLRGRAVYIHAGVGDPGYHI